MTATSISAMQKNTNGAQGAVLGALTQQPANETASTMLASHAKALVEARFVMAMRNPRDLDIVRQKLLRECQRPGFADAAIYNKPVGRGIEDLSIRFAEAAIRCMTNMTVDTSTVYDDKEKRIVKVEVADLESTTSYSHFITVQKTIERHKVKETDVVVGKRLNSKNEMVYIIEATDDDILNKENALISKALRTQALRHVPGDIKDECKALCYKVIADKAAQNPDAEKHKIFDSFATLGISVDQIKKYLGHNGEQLTPKEMQVLRGLYSALRDGETTWREIMDARSPTEPSAGDQKQTPSQKPAEEKPAAQATPVKQPEPEKVSTPNSVQVTTSATSSEDGKPTFNEVTRKLQQTKTIEEVMKLQEMADEVPNETHRKALYQMINNRMAALSEPSPKEDEKPKASASAPADKPPVKRNQRTFE